MKLLKGTVTPVIDVDGQTYAGHRDPPGQSSVYIRPGDAWRENYRLSTFVQFPTHAAVFPKHLTSSGFYYTGYKDRVKCFSCGLCVENWVQGDDPRDKKWHRNDCELANGMDTTNVPLPNVFENFHINNISSPMPVPAPSAMISSQYVPTRKPPTHSNSFSSLSTSLQSTSPSVNPATRAPSAQSPNSAEHQEMYSCLAPVNPHMSSPVHRMETFRQQHVVRWPREQLRASIDELVNAGFYYLGERDRVKCWYCNGGLQNWDYEDEPWTEHAKWFPSCEFLLKVKGPIFVEAVVAKFPYLNRPQPSTVLPSPRNLPREMPSSQSVPRGSVLTHEEPVNQAMLDLSYVKQARDMGFDEDIIKSVLKRKYETNGRFYNSSEEFLDAVFSYQPYSTPEHGTNNSMNNVASNNTGNPLDVKRELEMQEESRRCRICRKEPSDIVFIPCGHLASCNGCSAGLKRCPMCNGTIQDMIKTFRA